jgi:predicted patatin/cPLA2 family phospholipase
MDVLALMNQRRSNSSKPQKRDDKFKLGLAVEGGGMRGVVSAGMLTALEHLGYTDTFDAVYGSSAGSINCAYFLAKQSAYGTSIYYNDANCSNFISWWRVFAKRAPMQLDYLLYHIFKNVKVLDWRTILDSGIELNVLASSLDNNKTIIFNSFHECDDILLALKASSCIPWFAGDPVVIHGERLVDASFFESIPYVTAIKSRCTHLLVLRTRPYGARRESVSILEKIVLKKYFKNGDSRHYDYYINSRSSRYNKTVELLESPQIAVEGSDIKIDSIAMQNKISVSQLEKDKAKLLEGAMSGYSCILNYFGHKNIVPVDVIAPFSQEGHEL